MKIDRPSNLNDSVRVAIIALRARDLSIRRIAAQLRVGTGTICKVLGAGAQWTGPQPGRAEKRL